MADTTIRNDNQPVYQPPPPQQQQATDNAQANAQANAQSRQDQQAAQQAGSFVPLGMTQAPTPNSSLSLPTDTQGTAGVSGNNNAAQLQGLQVAMAQMLTALTMMLTTLTSMAQGQGNQANSANSDANANSNANTNTQTSGQTAGNTYSGGSNGAGSTTGGSNTAGSGSNVPTRNRVNAAASSGDVGGTSNSLGANKRTAASQADALGATPREKAVILAVGMQESDHMNRRDASKDSKGGAANVSAFNVNADLIKSAIKNSPELQQKYGNTDPSKLSQKAVIDVMIHAQRQMGEAGFLNFMRGGSTGYRDGHSYGAAEYRNKVASVAQSLLNDPSKMTNNHRYAHNIGGV